ncbi:MAG: family 78 glycoside hydrolase catalytic domain [Lentisphaerota bacterium]
MRKKLNNHMTTNLKFDYAAPTSGTDALPPKVSWKGAFLSVPCTGGGGRGYFSKTFPAGTPFELWVQIDLGQRESFDRLVLWAVCCPEVGEIAGTGLGFPVRFRIEGADEAGFKEPELIYETKDDVFNPGRDSLEISLPATACCRFVRLTVLQPYGKVSDCTDKALGQSQFFALDEFQIFSGTENIALGKPVKAPNVNSTSIEIGAYDWHPDCLTDGIIHPREVRRDAGGGNLLRRLFSLAKPVVRARACVASKGFYELGINGKKVGDAVLDSAWTNYNRRLLYSTWDCGELLHGGNNVITLLVGNGWTLSPAVILQLSVEHPDGSTSELCSDTSWRLLPSPVRENHIFHGEIYDASLENPAIHSAEFDDRGYPYAKVLEGYSPVLSAQLQPPIRVVETIAPISLSQPQPGVWVFDMGRNIAGWARVRVPGGDRREVKLRFAETIFDDGSVWTDPAQTQSRKNEVWEDFRKRHILYRTPEDMTEDAKFATADGMINNANYRVARATDRYLTNGSPDETTWEPRFVYHGFRFVELTNYPGIPSLETISGRVVHTDLRSIGGFECSNPVLNWAFEASRRTLLNNLHSVPTDCCQRDERQGWGCDARVASEAMLFNFDAAATYVKWLQDWRDCQRADGAFPDSAPYSLGRMGGDIMWGTTSIFVAWQVYLHTGDLRVLEEHFPAILAYLAFLEHTYPGFFADDANFGDWLATEPTPSAIVENTAWYGAVSVAALAAAALGHEGKRKSLEAVARKIAAVFQRRLFDSCKGLYGTQLQNASPEPRSYGWEPCFDRQSEGGSQASQVLPLRFGLVPPEWREHVFAGLVANVEKRKRHLSTGLSSNQYLLEILSECGRPDLAYAISSTEEFPGWGYMKNHGATTLWEHWEHLTGNGMNSHNHPAFTGIAAWMMKYVAGIQPSPEDTGFRKVILAPVFPEGLDYATGKLETPLGLIRTSWKRDDTGIVFEAQLPAGCIGILRLPPPSDGHWVCDGAEHIPSEVTCRFHAKWTKGNR